MAARIIPISSSEVAAPLNAMARRAFRKAAIRMVPLLTLGYLFNYLDRTCVAFAGLTLKSDVGLTASQFGLGAGIFFVGYCLFEFPSNMVLYRVGARRWLARIMITWGLLSACTAFVVGPKSFIAIRLLLGIAEAGFAPGVIYFLAAWFPAEYRTRAIALFGLGIPLSSVVGGPICGTLLQLSGVAGLAGWQWLFVVVSMPCVVIGILILLMLADSPNTAAWLTLEERDAAMAALAAETHEAPTMSLTEALSDVRVWILCGVQFCFTLGSYGIGIWLPLILAQGKLTSFEIGLLSAVPYIFAMGAMLLWAAYVDRAGRRVDNMTIAWALGAVGLGGALLLPGHLWLTVPCLTVALMGVTAGRSVFWTIPPRFLTGAAAAGGLAFISTIGTTGGFVGPYMVGALKDLTGSFLAGIGGMASFMALAVLLSLSLKLVMARE